MTRFLPIFVIVGAAAVYHISQKSVAKDANPWAVLSLVYLGAFLFTFVMWSPWKDLVKAREVTAAIPVAIILALACVGIEAGYLFAYQSGWKVTQLTTQTSAGISVALLLVGTLFFRESMTSTTLLGFLFAAGGVALTHVR